MSLPFLLGLRACAAMDVCSFAAGMLSLVIALGGVPQTPLVGDRVDVVELNRVYDDSGQPILTQMIFWDWHERNHRLHVVAWRLWHDDGPRPTRDWPHGEYVLLWHDGELLREVRAPLWRESWTQYDPEMLDRQQFPKANRRGLTRDLSETKPSAVDDRID